MCKASIKIVAFKGFLSFMNQFNGFIHFFPQNQQQRCCNWKAYFLHRLIQCSFLIYFFWKLSITIQMLIYFMCIIQTKLLIKSITKSVWRLFLMNWCNVHFQVTFIFKTCLTRIAIKRLLSFMNQTNVSIQFNLLSKGRTTNIAFKRFLSYYGLRQIRVSFSVNLKVR